MDSMAAGGPRRAIPIQVKARFRGGWVGCPCLAVVYFLWICFFFSKLVVPKSDHFSGGGPICVCSIVVRMRTVSQCLAKCFVQQEKRILVLEDNKYV